MVGGPTCGRRSLELRRRPQAIVMTNDRDEGLTPDQLQFLLQWCVEGTSTRFQSAEDSDYGADAGCAERRRRRQVQSRDHASETATVASGNPNSAQNPWAPGPDQPDLLQRPTHHDASLPIHPHPQTTGMLSQQNGRNHCPPLQAWRNSRPACFTCKSSSREHVTRASRRLLFYAHVLTASSYQCPCPPIGPSSPILAL